MSDVENKLIELINSINTLSDSVNAIQGSITHLSEQLSELDNAIKAFNTVKIIATLDEVKTKVDAFSNIENKLNELSELGAIKDSLKFLTDLPSIRTMLGVLDEKVEKMLKAPSVQPSAISQVPAEDLKPVTTAKAVSSSQILKPDFEIKDTAEKAVSTKKEEYVSPALVDETPSVISTAAADAQVAINAMQNKFKHILQMISPQSPASSVLKFLEELRDEVETSVGMSPMLYEINSWLKKIDRFRPEEPLHPETHSELTEKLSDWQERVLAAIRRKYE